MVTSNKFDAGEGRKGVVDCNYICKADIIVVSYIVRACLLLCMLLYSHVILCDVICECCHWSGGEWCRAGCLSVTGQSCVSRGQDSCVLSLLMCRLLYAVSISLCLNYS